MTYLATLPAPVRHLLLLIAAVLLTWLGTDVIPLLNNQSNIAGALLASLLAAFLAYVTPLVQGYGLGKKPPAGDL